MTRIVNFQLRNTILCEDIRQEKSNKYILVGVYAGDILVEKLPCDIPLSIYLEGSVNADGEGTLYIRLSGPGEGSGKMGMKYSSGSGAGVLVTPRLDVHMECAGIFRVEISEDQKSWTTVIERRVRQESNLWTLVPIAKPSSSGESPSDDPVAPSRR